MSEVAQESAKSLIQHPSFQWGKRFGQRGTALDVIEKEYAEAGNGKLL